MAETVTLEREATQAFERAKKVYVKGRYRPSQRSWEVLLALRSGPLPCSTWTVAGAHVSGTSAGGLARRGLVVTERRDDGVVWAELTEAGMARAERGA